MSISVRSLLFCGISYLMCAFFAPLTGQEYTFNVQQFGIEEGLAHRHVSSIFKDNKGFIWFRTNRVIQRYDGYTFRSFSIQTPEGKIRPSSHIGQIPNDHWIWLVCINPLIHYQQDLYFLHQTTGEVITKEERLGATLAAQLDSLLNTMNYHGMEVHNDRLFFLSKSENQIAIFDFNKGTTFLPINLGLNTADRIILVDSKGHIWVNEFSSPSFYLHQISPTGEIVTSIELNRSLPNKVTTLEGRFIFEWQGNIFFTTFSILPNGKQQQNFYKLTNGGEQLLMEIPEEHLVLQFAEGFLWCLGPEGWKIYDHSGKLVIEIAENDYRPMLFNGFFMQDFEADQNGNFYICSEFGLNIVTIQQNPFTNYFSNTSTYTTPVYNSARGIYADEDILVVNFEFGGLVRFNDKQVDDFEIIPFKGQRSTVSQDKKNNYSGRPILREKSGHYVIGQDGLSSYWSPDLSIQKDLSDTSESPNLQDGTWAIFKDNKGCYWSARSLAFRKVCEQGAKGDLILYKDVGISKPDILVYIYQIQPAHDDLVWLSSSHGLFLFNLAEERTISHYHTGGQGEYYLPSDHIYFLHIDAQNNKWLGTNEGLIFWNEKTNEKKLFSRNDGLSNNVIYAIFEDTHNRLWLSSDYGIMSFHKETHNVQSYHIEDGIAHEEFNRISHFQKTDGTIYFGGLNGVTSFHPDDLFHATKKQEQVHIIAYEIFDGHEGKVVDKTDALAQTNTITFFPDDRFFKLEFTLPTFEENNRPLYGWKIEGVYEDWTFQKENSLQFGVLPYGSHTLRIKGQSAGNGWSPHEAVIQIHVLKPFYLKTWFIFAALLTLVGGVALFYSARTKLLKKEIAKATNTIAKQAEELRALDKLKSRFFANVSHELRTPLSLMLGPIRRLIKKRKPDQEDQELLGFLERNTVHLKGLVNEILDLSKLENNKMELQPEPTNFYSFIENHLNQFYSVGYSESVKVTSNIKVGKGLNILLDQNKFQKVINNFVSNAIKFSPVQEEVVVSIEEEKSLIQIKVSDKGRGIHPDDLLRVFDRFYQSKITDAPAEGGTGIGLSMCKELAELMNGKVWVESVLGKGSTFYFSFPKILAKEAPINIPQEVPLLENKKNATTAKTNKQNKASKRIKILIAEDNKDLRNYYKIILSDYQLITTEHGQEALEYLQQNEVPDLIISDLMMPVMDGMQFLNRLKSSEQWWHIPVIMLTAKTNQSVKIQALRYGIDDYLNKPFDEEELRVRIHNLLKHRDDRKSFSDSETTEKEESNTRQLSKQDQEWLESLESYILSNINDEFLSVSSLSKAFAMSESTLLRQLKKLTGLPPVKYLLEIKLNHAKALIQNNCGGGLFYWLQRF